MASIWSPRFPLTYRGVMRTSEWRACFMTRSQSAPQRSLAAGKVIQAVLAVIGEARTRHQRRPREVRMPADRRPLPQRIISGMIKPPEGGRVVMVGSGDQSAGHPDQWRIPRFPSFHSQGPRKKYNVPVFSVRGFAPNSRSSRIRSLPQGSAFGTRADGSSGDTPWAPKSQLRSKRSSSMPP